MNYKAVFGILLALVLLAVPVMAADTSVLDDLIKNTPAADDSSTTDPETGGDVSTPEVEPLAPGANNYGYLKITSVSYNLYKEDADVTVNYIIEPWISFLVTFFGKEDLEKRINGVLQYPETGYDQVITVKYLGSDKAILHITNVAVDNQGGSYWFKAHSFGCTIPELTLTYPDGKKIFTNVQVMPKGFGYFS